MIWVMWNREEPFQGLHYGQVHHQLHVNNQRPVWPGHEGHEGREGHEGHEGHEGGLADLEQGGHAHPHGHRQSAERSRGDRTAEDASSQGLLVSFDSDQSFIEEPFQGAEAGVQIPRAPDELLSLVSRMWYVAPTRMSFSARSCGRYTALAGATHHPLRTTLCLATAALLPLCSFAHPRHLHLPYRSLKGARTTRQGRPSKIA